MNIFRLQDAANRIHFAYDQGDGTVVLCRGDLFTGVKPTKDTRDFADLKVLPPIMPGKIIGIGLNYRGHAQEHGLPVPDRPLMFFKPISAVVGPGDAIRVTTPDRRTDAEAELVVVIGRIASNVPEAHALDYVAGYTCGNDVSERDAQNEDKGWPGRSKGYDTFAPIGPSIATTIDPGARIQARINGRIVQDSRIDDLIFSIPELVSFVSSVVTLEPGDLIFTGTPAGVSPIRPGDEVSVTIDGVGALSNPVGAR